MSEFSASNRVKFLPLLMALSMILSVTLPYAFTIVQEKLRMFLPFISHAAAFPPQSAFFSIFMAIGAFFGFPTFFLRYIVVDHKRNRLEPKKIRYLNMIALVSGWLAIIATLINGYYPIGYVTHEKEDWMKSVVIPHFSFTALLITLYTVYVFIQAFLTYTQRKKSTKNVFVHAALAMCIVITNWTTCLPFYAALREMAPQVVNSENGQIILESKEYSFYYIISSLSEWGFTFFSVLFISTFYRDFKRVKVTLKLTRKPITLDTVEDPPHIIINGNDEMTKM